MTQMRHLTCDHAGTKLKGFYAVPQSTGPHPAVLVMHDALGLGDQVKERAQTLAEMGYVAVATDMYGGGVHFSDPKDAGGPFSALQEDPQLLRARVVAWYETVKALPEVDPDRIAAIGFCFGGQCVLELARSGADVKAVVSYHGLLKTALPAQPGAVKAKVVVFSGAQDPYAPLSDVDALREEMSTAGASWQTTVFSDAAHAFTDPNAGTRGMPGIFYEPLADRQSWAATLSLLEAVL